MKKFERVVILITYILAGVYFLGTVFRFFSWPVGNIITILTLSLFCYLYLAFSAAIAFRKKPFNGLNISSSFIGGLGAVLGLVAVLYNIMDWPGYYEVSVVAIPVVMTFLVLRMIKVIMKGLEFQKIDKIILVLTLFIGSTIFV